MRPSAAGVVRGCWCAVAGAQCAVRVQTQLGANRLLAVAWGSAGRSLAQVSASFAVFCDGRRTPRLRVLSLLRLCSDMLERARGSEREREEGCGDLQVRGVQRERCAVSARNRLAGAKGSEKRGVVICKVLGVQIERERCAVSA